MNQRGGLSRVPLDWDMEIFQQRYPMRSEQSRFWHVYKNGTAASWQTPRSAPSTADQAGFDQSNGCGDNSGLGT
jgi:hypothetical protein